MFRVASALIVMALAASPTAKVICDLACAAKPTSTGHHACHEARDESGPAVAVTPVSCARIAAVAPFTPGSAYRVAPAASVSVVLAVADDVHGRGNPGRLPARVDTGPPTDRTVAVLRI